ncbi:MAG: LysR family transcriptional regulator [Sphingomonadales bacterium]
MTRGERDGRGEHHTLFARQLDWNLLKIFHEIVSAGGISAAARSLNRRQPTVSAALKRLEDRLGMTLCVRTSRGIELNSAGRALFAACETMHDAVTRLPNETAKAAGTLTGSLTVRMISDLVSPQLDRAAILFHRLHPAVEIRLDIAPWRSVIASVRAGETDIGIACDSAPSEDMHYESLMAETQQLYCGPSHPLFGHGPRHPREFVGDQFVLTGQDEPEELERFRRRFGLGRRAGGFAETLHEVKRLIHLGIGIGFLPTIVAEPEGSERLWPLLPPEMLPSYHVYLITRPADTLAPAARSLLEMIRSTTKP